MNVQVIYKKVCDMHPMIMWNELKEEQVEVLSLLLKNNNVFGVLPTGFGKSLLFTLFTLMMDEVRP